MLEYGVPAPSLREYRRLQHVQDTEDHARMKLHGSLESRICILTTGLLFALLLAVGHVEMSGQKAALVEERADRYETLSKVLALSYAPLGDKNDTALYREFTSRIMHADRDITYVIISDSKRSTLFALNRDEAASEKRRHKLPDAGQVLASVRRIARLDSPEFSTVHVPARITPDEMGTITVGFASGSIDAAIEDSQNRLLAAFAAALLIGLLGALSLARAITRPLRDLILAAGKVETGDLDVSIPIRSRDELGTLASGFNRMVVALRESRDRLVQRANTDSLTGLHNHRHFQERLATELSRAERFDRPLSVVMLDIDNFKALNDTHGHPIGDLVLKEVAKLLTSEVRDIDVVARYGGEEFALILPETSVTEARMAAERVRLAVQRHCFVGRDGQSIPVTISLGTAQYPIHSTEREGLIMAADLAMYQAKSMGRNRSVAFSSELREDKSTDPYKLYLLLHATDMSTIEAMAAAVDAKGQRYPGFSRDVMKHAVALARELGMGEEEQNDVRIASLLHDIGKLGMPDSVLNKNGIYTDEERRLIRGHPAMGYAIVQKSPHLRSMLPGILYHHEWWDGGGYPNCLKGQEIPVIARIIAIVDAYHAMMTSRPHASTMTASEARDELRRCAGTQFDPKMVKVFLGMLDREEPQAEAA